MATKKFLRVKSGAVYHYSDRLAKRSDAIVVDGHAAAAYFRSIGSVNKITKAYPERKIDSGVPMPKAPASRVKKAETPVTIVEPVSDAETVDDHVAKLLSGDGSGA
tara:strand:- start:7910 stop:8227 length:318 start_codon:yes stop_codon:yes gene_type:complete